jgi:RND family efflux transporter MFP subunit
MVLCLALAGCGTEPPPTDPVIRPIKMLTIGSDLMGVRQYPGRIRAGQQADMAFEVHGRIMEFVFKEGSTVEKGEVLARLDPRDYQNQLEQAQALDKHARTQLGRIELAHRTRAVSDQDLSDAKAAVEVAEAEVRIKQKAVEDTELRAPFDGIMSRKLVEDFANVQAKEPVLIFEDPGHLEVKVSVPERDLAGRRWREQTAEAITERLKPEVNVTALPDDRFPAVVKELATTADPTTRTFEATFIFDNPKDVVVLPGMTARVTLKLARAVEEGEVLIPAQASFADAENGANVWIVDQDSMAVLRHPVTLGRLTGDSVLVTAGLSEGDVIATSGVAHLRDGMVVRRWER